MRKLNYSTFAQLFLLDKRPGMEIGVQDIQRFSDAIKKYTLEKKHSIRPVVKMPIPNCNTIFAL